MKTTSLFQLGGIAILLSAILSSIGALMYFLSGQPDQPTALRLWLDFIADALLVLGLGGLFARQSQRGGLLGLVGYVLLVVAIMFFVGTIAVLLGVSAGVISNAQIAQVPSYTFVDSIVLWIWVAGLIVFGISIYRADVLPKYAGALLVLQGLVQPFMGSLDFLQPIVAIVYLAAWAWLGWALLADRGGVAREPVPSRAYSD